MVSLEATKGKSPLHRGIVIHCVLSRQYRCMDLILIL
jgi:hypothetical protein